MKCLCFLQAYLEDLGLEDADVEFGVCIAATVVRSAGWATVKTHPDVDMLWLTSKEFSRCVWVTGGLTS